MTALLFDGLVTSGKGSPTPAPPFPIDTPVIFDAVASATLSGATLVSSQSAPSLDTAVTIPVQAVPSIDTPTAASAQPTPAISTPEFLTATAVDPEAPPFPLNHMRILWDNLLFNYSSVSASTGSNQSDAIIPNTWQRWNFTSSGWIKIIMPTAITIDTIAIGATSLVSGGYTVRPYYRVTPSDPLVAFGAAKTPDYDGALMWHNSSTVSVEVIEIYTSGGSGAGFIGYIMAGIALQMQRPFFGGYTPVNENIEYTYYDAWTETGQLVGRSERSVMLSGSYPWENISDTWYREYFEPFKRVGHRLPFISAWNLDQYPDDVEMVLAEKIEAAAYSGTRDLRSINITVKGVV